LGDILPGNEPEKVEARLADAVVRVARAKADLAAVIH
jgi:hypothetical protein